MVESWIWVDKTNSHSHTPQQQQHHQSSAMVLWILERIFCVFFCRWNGFICNVLIVFEQRMNIVVNKRKITNIFWRETKTQIAQTKNHLFKQSRNSCRVEKLETTKRRIEREQNLLGKKHDSKNDAIKTN